jgi:hypothetical protein
MPWPVAHGPDIAHYQNLTGEPVDPAWRLFSHKCSEGANSGDVTFPSRWKWMRTQGFRYRGAYHWLRSDTPIAAQAPNIIGRLDAQGGLRPGEFVQSDWETTPNITVNTAEHEREFCDRLEQHYGRACTITYSSDWIPDSDLDPDQLSEFFEWLDLTQGAAPLWYANYNSDPLNPQGGQQECKRYGADVWQFTSSYRHPSIVSQSGGGFDMNHVIRWETLDRIAGYTHQEADVLVRIKTPPATIASGPTPPWWPHIGLFDSGVARPMVNNDLALPAGVSPEQLGDEGQYRRLAVSIGIDLTNEFPDGNPQVEVEVDVPPVAFPGYVGSITLAPGTP